MTELSKEKEALQQKFLCSEIQGLKEEVKSEQNKAVQLWHANCQQLLTNDSEMLEKEREIQVLFDDTVEPVIGEAKVYPLGSYGQDSKPVITTLPVWSARSVRQLLTTTSPTTTSTATVVTTTPLFQPGTQDIATRAIYTQSQLPRVLQ